MDTGGLTKKIKEAPDPRRELQGVRSMFGGRVDGILTSPISPDLEAAA